MASKPTVTFFLLSIVCLNVQVLAQSNYASHGNNINYIGNGLPEETLLDGKVSDIEPFYSRVGDYCYMENRPSVFSCLTNRFFMPNCQLQSRLMRNSQNEIKWLIDYDIFRDLQVTKLDDLSPIIFLNRTKAALNCGAGSMEVNKKNDFWITF